MHTTMACSIHINLYPNLSTPARLEWEMALMESVNVEYHSGNQFEILSLNS